MKNALRYLILILLLPSRGEASDVIYIRGGVLRSGPAKNIAELKLLKISNPKGVIVSHNSSGRCAAPIFMEEEQVFKVSKEIFSDCAESPLSIEESSREYANLPIGLVFVPNLGRFWAVWRMNKLELHRSSKDWLTAATMTVTTDEPGIELCFSNLANDGSIITDCKKRKNKAQNFNEFYIRDNSLKKLNNTLIAYKEANISFPGALATFKDANISFGKFFLEPLNYKKNVCDGAIIKPFTIKIAVGGKEGIGFDIEGAYTFCSPEIKDDSPNSWPDYSSERKKLLELIERQETHLKKQQK